VFLELGQGRLVEKTPDFKIIRCVR
jgi:hypothetical protein